MKYIKYFAAALVLVASLASCSVFEDAGDPGNTTVQFAQAVVEDGFGAGVVYVPLTITADTEKAMNSCDVKATLKVVETGAKFEGKPDVDGINGDYRVTSLDVNFPAYDSYYNDKEPEKYKDPETGKYVKTVYVEVLIINDTPEELNFTFEIESATTTIGEQKQCKVVLVKSTRDRMCGNFVLTCDQVTDGLATTVAWDNQYECFEIEISSVASGLPLYTYYDEENECMLAFPYEALAYANAERTIVWFSSFYTDWENKTFADDYVVITFDATSGTLTFPEDLGFIFTAYYVDENFTPTTCAGRINTMDEPFTKVVLTKK